MQHKYHEWICNSHRHDTDNLENNTFLAYKIHLSLSTPHQPGHNYHYIIIIITQYYFIIQKIINCTRISKKYKHVLITIKTMKVFFLFVTGRVLLIFRSIK